MSKNLKVEASNIGAYKRGDVLAPEMAERLGEVETFVAQGVLSWTIATPHFDASDQSATSGELDALNEIRDAHHALTNAHEERGRQLQALGIEHDGLKAEYADLKAAVDNQVSENKKLTAAREEMLATNKRLRTELKTARKA